MIKPYKIIDIVHSGRKDIRGKRVTAEKYTDVIGSTILLDVDKIVQFKCINFLFKNHPEYDYWTTSEVLALKIDMDDVVHIETANSIYICEPLFTDEDED